MPVCLPRSSSGCRESSYWLGNHKYGYKSFRSRGSSAITPRDAIPPEEDAIQAFVCWDLAFAFVAPLSIRT